MASGDLSIPQTDHSQLDISDQDVPGSLEPFLMQSTAMNASAMADIFHDIVQNLPQVIDTLHEPVAAGDGHMIGNGSPTLASGDNTAALQIDVHFSALQFAANHPTPLAVLFQDMGMHGWVRFCNRLTLSCTAHIGTESLRVFRQRRVEDTLAFIVSEYEEVIREGGAPLEDGAQAEMIAINNSFVRSSINTPEFLCVLFEMVLEDIPRVVYAAWLEAAKNIVEIICPQNTYQQSLHKARQFCRRVAHHGIDTFQFFHDILEEQDATPTLFNGPQVRQTMALALRNIAPLLDGNSPDTFFGIYNRVRGNDGILRFRLLEISPTHTTNIVSSMVILVLDTHYIHRQQFPAMSERKMTELKGIFNANRLSFRNVIACSQGGAVLEAIQELMRHNLLDILPNSSVF